MNRKLFGLLLLTAVLGGIVGAVTVRLWAPRTAFAQEQMGPAVISAKSFVLVNDSGQRRGVFSLTRDGSAMLRLYDENGKVRVEVGNSSPAFSNRKFEKLFDVRILDPDGRVAWSAEGDAGLLPLGKKFR